MIAVTYMSPLQFFIDPSLVVRMVDNVDQHAIP